MNLTFPLKKKKKKKLTLKMISTCINSMIKQHFVFVFIILYLKFVISICTIYVIKYMIVLTSLKINFSKRLM